MFLDRLDQRLDQEDVPLAAVGLELHLQTVVGEPADPGGAQGDAQVCADLLGQLGMGTTAEHGDVSHGPLLA